MRVCKQCGLVDGMRRYEEWDDLDRHVKKGERAQWVDNVALFCECQTEENHHLKNVRYYEPKRR